MGGRNVNYYCEVYTYKKEGRSPNESVQKMLCSTGILFSWLRICCFLVTKHNPSSLVWQVTPTNLSAFVGVSTPDQFKLCSSDISLQVCKCESTFIPTVVPVDANVIYRYIYMYIREIMWLEIT